MDGCIVGTGTDYVVIQKERKRYLIEILPSTIKELKNASTPYGSQIDWFFVHFCFVFNIDKKLLNQIRCLYIVFEIS